jgi:hypothetical protein
LFRLQILEPAGRRASPRGATMSSFSRHFDDMFAAEPLHLAV